MIAAGLAVLGMVTKWLLITAALLVAPFSTWWSLDHSRRRSTPAGTAPVTAPIPVVPVHGAQAYRTGARRAVGLAPPDPLPSGSVAPDPVPLVDRPAPVAAAADGPCVPAPREAPSVPFRSAAGREDATVTGTPVAVGEARVGQAGATDAGPGRRRSARTSPAPGTRAFLTPDRRVMVTGEDAHQDTLARHHTERPLTRVTAELCPALAATGPDRGAYAVEVRLAGVRVGELGASASRRYRRLVDADGSAACLGTIAHGERGYEIELRLPKR